MDKIKSVEEKIKELVTATQEKNYRGRKMVVSVHSHTDDLKNFVVNGTLHLSVSETPEDKESWTDREFSVMIIETDPDLAVAEVFAHLNSIPMEYGDMIFEDDFKEVIKLLEESSEQTKISTSQAAI